MAPKVSIVLPSYNGEKYIHESINSIIKQSFEDWELILIDDCSSDYTPAIMDRYAIDDSRITVIHNKENKRLPQSLNIGFSVASGKYLTWTSDDNIYMPKAIEDMCSIIDKNINIPMVCADYVLIDDKGAEGDACVCTSDDIWFTNHVGACFLYRREVLKTVGEYNTSLFLVEDYDYWIRIMEQYGNIYHLPKVLYKYRRHNGSLSEKRINEVNISRSLLREKHRDSIVANLLGDRDKLFGIFYDNYICGRSNSLMNQMIAEKYPEFSPLLVVDKYDKVVIFGAGNFGLRYAEQTDKEILYFVDNNSAIVGHKIGDYVIKSSDELKKISDDITVIIAVANDTKPILLKQLYDMGITHIDIF